MTNPTITAIATEGTIQQQAEIIANALRKLKPTPRQQKEQLIAILYPDIVASIKSGVTQKQIRAQLASFDIKLHPSRFKQLMGAAAEAQSSEAQCVSGIEASQEISGGAE